MTIKDFGELLAGNNGVKISKELVIYNDFELYNYNTEESKCYNSLDELVNDNADVKKIIEEAEGFYLEFNGGRGASGDGAMGGGFTSAGGGGKHEKDYGKSLYPAELNLDNKNGTSVDHVIDKFKTKYADAKIEYGITVNEQGYATKHIQVAVISVRRICRYFLKRRLRVLLRQALTLRTRQHIKSQRVASLRLKNLTRLSARLSGLHE